MTGADAKSARRLPARPLPPWQKTLYGNAGYPDNHTDITFLKDLQTNQNVRTFTYAEALAGVTRLNRQITSCCLFIRIFQAMYAQHVRPETVFAYSTVCTVIGYALFVVRHVRGAGRVRAHIADTAQTVLAVLVSGYILAPMMHTLTDSISTDTIFTLTLCVLAVHLIFFDYGLPAFMASKAISLNAALFASICLASRLRTARDAFVLLCVAAEFFVLFPRLVQAFWRPAWMAPLAALCVWSLWDQPAAVGLYVLGAVVLVNGVCPVAFVYMQQFKLTVHGPWDEAIVRDSDLAQETQAQADDDEETAIEPEDSKRGTSFD